MRIDRMNLTLYLSGASHQIATVEYGDLYEYLNIVNPYAMKLMLLVADAAKLKVVVIDEEAFACLNSPLPDPFGWRLRFQAYDAKGHIIGQAVLEDSAVILDKELDRDSLADVINRLADGDHFKFPFRVELR